MSAVAARRPAGVPTGGQFAAAVRPEADLALVARERAAATAARDEEAASFERCDTDGFASQAASAISGRQHTLAADIAERGGTWTFPALHLHDPAAPDGRGARVRAKLIDGKFGQAWAIVGQDGQFTGQFISAHPKRPDTMTRKGFVEATEDAPAAATTWAPPGARGIGGMSQVRVLAVRTDGGFPEDAADLPAA